MDSLTILRDAGSEDLYRCEGCGKLYREDEIVIVDKYDAQLCTVECLTV